MKHQRLVDELAHAGIAVAFGLRGEDTAALTADLKRVGIRYFAAGHENVALNMAVGHARASGGAGPWVLGRGLGPPNAATASGAAASQERVLAVVEGRRGATVERIEPARAVAPPEEVMGRVARMLTSAKRPLVLAGRGAVLADARSALESVADRVAVPLGTSLGAKDYFSGSCHEFGVVGGLANAAGSEYLAEVDCLLVFGAGLDPYTTAFGQHFQEASIVRFDLCSVASHVDVDLDVVADARLAADGLVAAIEAGEYAGRREVLRPRSFTQQRPWESEDRSTDEAVDPRRLCRRLDEILPHERIVSCDPVHATLLAASTVRVPHPSRFHVPQRLGTIGVGLGHALGVAVALPGPRHVLFIGDGGLSTALDDLATVAQYRLPLTIVVLNDKAGRQARDLGGIAHRRARCPDFGFAAAARAVGIEGWIVRTVDELDDLEPILSGPRELPLVLDCQIVSDIW